MTNHPHRSKQQQAKPSPATAAKWAALAEEAIADADEWKRQCREAQDLNRELLAALKLVRDEYCEGGMLDGTPVGKAIGAATAKAEQGR